MIVFLLTFKGEHMNTVMERVKKNTSDVNELLFRLERNHTEIQTLLARLNSYTCEPTNYECFERLRDLRDDIESLKASHLELFREIDAKQLNGEEDLVAKMRHQIKAFKELDTKIGIYVLDTKGY
jgi:two-component sensor histidine kinase